MGMIKNSRNQRGSTRIVIVVVLVGILLGALGFVYWHNFISSKSNSTDLSEQSESKSKNEFTKSKSEILPLENSDMNRYVNYEKGFEFLFPKQILTNNQCQAFDAKRDTYGNWSPSERHYGAADGQVEIIILESGDEYIMVPKYTVVQSSPKGDDEKGYIFTSCEVVPTTLQILERTKKDSYGIENIGLEYRSFRVIEAKNDEEALVASRTVFNDQEGMVEWTPDGAYGRKSGKFIRDPIVNGVGGFDYRLWYYPERKKVVYIMIGQSRWFAYADGSDNTYDDKVVESFKLLSE